MSRTQPNRSSALAGTQQSSHKSDEGDVSQDESGSESDQSSRSYGNNEESDKFLANDNTIEMNQSFSRSDSVSKHLGKDEVFSKFRRHSFRVGYFADEDTEGHDDGICRAGTM